MVRPEKSWIAVICDGIYCPQFCQFEISPLSCATCCALTSSYHAIDINTMLSYAVLLTFQYSKTWTKEDKIILKEKRDWRVIYIKTTLSAQVGIKSNQAMERSTEGKLYSCIVSYSWMLRVKLRIYFSSVWQFFCPSLFGRWNLSLISRKKAWEYLSMI